MDATNRKTLYNLPEYRALDMKRRKLISFHLLDGVAFSRACTMLGMNKTRESKREEITTCLAAFKTALDPTGDAEMWETIHRVEKMWGRGNTALNPAFANVNLPFEGIYVTPDGKPVNADGLPATAPQPATAATPEATQHATPCAACQKTIPAETTRYDVGAVTVCGHCRHVWNHTGVKPTGPSDPNLTRIEPQWGLNVVTVPDYVAPLPEVPRG
jgi:hypothetical protein